MKILIKVLTSIFILSLFTLTGIAQDHSKMEFDCSLCHACETPTKSNPCLIPCPREKMMTVHRSPEESPAVVTMNKLEVVEDLYEPVIFSHRAHAEMAEMSGGCEMCHHYNPPGNVVPCNNCHEPSRQRTDITKPDLKAAYHRLCIDCHREWSNDIACESCHELNESGKSAFAEKDYKEERVHPEISVPAKLVYQTPEYDETLVTFFHNEHNDLYGFECIDCHQEESCAKCHDTTEPPKSKDVEFTIKHKKCASCHDTEDNCESCHMTEELEPFNHKDRTGFELASYHAKLSCVQCHQTKESFTGLSSNCNTCHADWSPENFDHSKVGIILSENHIEWSCEVCHENRNFSAQPTCSTCHDEDITYPDFIPGEEVD